MEERRREERAPAGKDGVVGLSLGIVSVVLFLFVWWLGSGQGDVLTSAYYRFFGISVRGNALLFTVLVLGLAAGVVGIVFSNQAFESRRGALSSAAKIISSVGLAANAFLFAFSILFAIFFPVV